MGVDEMKREMHTEFQIQTHLHLIDIKITKLLQKKKQILCTILLLSPSNLNYKTFQDL
jgi:hypothetical protein